MARHYVEVEVDLDDFDDDEIKAECEARGLEVKKDVIFLSKSSDLEEELIRAFENKDRAEFDIYLEQLMKRVENT